jgi:hypothetical protein
MLCKYAFQPSVSHHVHHFTAPFPHVAATLFRGDYSAGEVDGEEEYQHHQPYNRRFDSFARGLPKLGNRQTRRYFYFY